VGDGQVPDDMLACSRHWYQVDSVTRARVYREWRNRPHSPEHLQACHAAIGQMSELPPPRARAR
jgi:hypothetical protein